MREISLSVCLLYVMVLIISYEYKHNWTEDAQNNNVIIVNCISYRAANL